MRFLSALVLAAVAGAQSPLTTTFANNNAGSVGGGVYFNLTALNPAGVTICQVALNLSSVASTVGTIDTFTQANTSIPHTGVGWVPVSSLDPITAAGPGQQSVFNLSTPLTIPGGTTVGVAFRANGVAHAYTNGINAYPVPGNIFANADLSLNAGQASNVAFAGAAFTPRMVNTSLSYVVGPTAACPPPATVTSQGTGCYTKFASFYENFATAPAFDLANAAITLSPTGTGYSVTQAGTYNAVGSLGTPTVLALTDDSQVAAGTLGLTVGSNGWVALAAGNSNGFVPTVSVLLSNPATAFYSWHDMNPTIVGSGTVKYEESGTLAQVTFDGVWDFAGTSAADANNIQFQINTATGACVIAWGTMSTLGASGTGHLVGYSPGGPSLDPGNFDLSTLGTLVTNTADQAPLSLTGVGRPVQGAVAVAYNVTTGNIPATGLIHIGILGLSRPLLPLAVIGAPGCNLNASLDLLIGPVIGPFGPTLNWSPLTLPAVPPAFYGLQFNCQGAVLGVPDNNAFGVGLVTSNGLKCTIGGI